jgi:hypothetical protein
MTSKQIYLSDSWTSKKAIVTENQIQFGGSQPPATLAQAPKPKSWITRALQHLNVLISKVQKEISRPCGFCSSLIQAQAAFSGVRCRLLSRDYLQSPVGLRMKWRSFPEVTSGIQGIQAIYVVPKATNRTIPNRQVTCGPRPRESNMTRSGNIFLLAKLGYSWIMAWGSEVTLKVFTSVSSDDHNIFAHVSYELSLSERLRESSP